ncbi:stage II sporulation protein R [Pontibacillus sp. HMF3514]|uniref:stage II sporulation protein R n=1 Tax=Pontibacillus sp. HMF3514 TaxID=2692425 RepID=UPI00131FB82D|nr:stage II sporulation protein R [Pontibacillus sp. HMF3514]QHE53817.1 stage II sporulation protein R [Pontibacillus sp. HMF3514]
MRKKKMIWGIVVLALLVTVFPMTLQGQQNTNNLDQYQVIPDEAIRLRILADSDGKKDQEIKREVRDAVNAEITDWVKELTSIEKARDMIESRLDELEVIVENVLEENNVSQSYSVDFDENVKFPTKLYGSYIYPAGTYEAILITLGEGQGANWWCVLFPPLCFLDFSNGTSVAAAEEDPVDKEEKVASAEGEKGVEVKFFLFEWLGSLFS